MRGAFIGVRFALSTAQRQNTDDVDRYFTLDTGAKVCTIWLATLDKTVAEVTQSSIVWRTVQSPTHHPRSVVDGAPQGPDRRSNTRSPLANSTFDFASWQGESTTSRVVLVGEICLPGNSDADAQTLDSFAIAEPPPAPLARGGALT
jgi:hypothetical protein